MKKERVIDYIEKCFRDEGYPIVRDGDKILHKETGKLITQSSHECVLEDLHKRHLEKRVRDEIYALSNPRWSNRWGTI